MGAWWEKYMCERLPADLFDRKVDDDPARKAIERRTLLMSAGALILSACALPRRGRRPGRVSLSERRTCVAPPTVHVQGRDVQGRDVQGRDVQGRDVRGEGVAEGDVVERRVLPKPTYAVVPRVDWGAAPLRENHDPMAGVRRITVHHTAELPAMSTRTDAELVKGVQRFHQDDRGWADIGYHYLIGRDGRVYQGRELHIQGAHAGGGNNVENLGVSVIGDFSDGLPTDTTLATLEGFLRAQMRIHDVDADQLFGHREFKPTACPGDALFGWLKAYREKSRAWR